LPSVAIVDLKGGAARSVIFASLKN